MGRDRTTGEALVRLSSDKGRTVVLTLKRQQLATLARGLAGLAQAEGLPAGEWSDAKERMR